MCNTYIVILSYKNIIDTLECLKSLSQLTTKNYQILLVENSEDRFYYEAIKDNLYYNDYGFSIAYLNEDELKGEISEQLIFIKAFQNRGFSAGNNIALNYLLSLDKDDYFSWILNNDTIVNADSLAQLINYYNIRSKEIKLGILGSKLIYYDKPTIIQALGGKFSKLIYASIHVGEGRSIDFDQKPDVDYIVGASMFMSNRFIKDVGLLSEDYFLYYEELDWIYRGNKFGYKIDYCLDSIVYHKEGMTIGSSSSGDKSDFSEINLFKSRKLFVKKFYSLNFFYYLSTILLLINRLRKGKVSLVKQLLKEI